jgi:D-sedoheptulose 7-phosphate isomerase
MSRQGGWEEAVRTALSRRLAVWERAASCAGTVATLAEVCARALGAGGQVIFFGNGGSAAQADHFAAEMVGRYQRDDRPPLAARALSQSGAVLTALGNDYGYDTVFARQVKAVARRGDVLIGLSTSGRSANVRAALECGRAAGCVTTLLTGDHEIADLPLVDHLIRVPARETAVIQELHLFCGHLLCELVDSAFAGQDA